MKDTTWIIPGASSGGKTTGHKDESAKEPPGIAQEERRHRLAQEHVEWFLRTIRPLLIDHFVHGYKHGWADRDPNERESPYARKNQGQG